MANPDMKSEQGALQNAGQVAQAAGQVTGSSVLMEDVGATERMRVENVDRSGQAASYDNDARSARGRHYARLDQMAEQAIQNAITIANAVATDGHSSRSVARDNLITNTNRQHVNTSVASIAGADQSLESPSELTGEAAILKAGQIDGATLAAINAAVAAAVTQALNEANG